MTTIDRLAEKGLLTRGADRRSMGGAYAYIPALSRGQLLAESVERLCASRGADQVDRAEPLAVLLGAAR